MKKKNIFIDTDMGNDDIMAICYLLLKKQFNILGISTVNGVSTKTYGIQNLSSILGLLNKKISINSGSQKALEERVARFPIYDTKRANKLSLLRKLPITKNPYQNNFLPIEDFIFESVKDKNATILCLGPLTNIAKTMQKYGNDFILQIKDIFMMGGGLEKGNVSPLFEAEYNIFLDPEAAQIVVDSEIPITMVGIDVTQYVPTSNIFTKKIKKIKPFTKEAKIIKEIIVNNNKDFSSFYDPLSVFLLSKPSAIKSTLQCGISILLSGKKRGKTLQDDIKQNVAVVTSVDANMFYKEFLQILERN